MTDRKPMDRLTLVVNVIVVALALWLLARPAGPIGNRLTEWREDRRIKAEIRASWTELARGPRADSNRAATQVIVAFSDYQCPACQIAHARFAELTRTERVGVVYRHVPNSRQHPMAYGAARAAICADRQGKFLEMNDRLFSSSDWQQEPIWTRLATEIGIGDTVSFRACLTHPSVTEEIARDLELADRLGYRGTPTLVGPRGMRLGIPTREGLGEILDQLD